MYIEKSPKCEYCGTEIGSFCENCCEDCWVVRAKKAEKWADEIRIQQLQIIQVWRFQDAPQEYQELSFHGGDEDWVVFIPQKIWDEECGMIGWCDANTRFGCCDVSDHEVEGGIVRIGAHS